MPRSSIAEAARAGTVGDLESRARQAISKGCIDVVIETVPGVLVTFQWPRSLLSSHSAMSQSGVSNRTDCVMLMPGLAQPSSSNTLIAEAMKVSSRQIAVWKNIC
jgi:hypothetical protein